MPVLDVYFYGKLVGKLTEKNSHLSFKYLPDVTTPISINLPLQEETFSDKETRSFFNNLLLEEEIRDAVARYKQVSSNNPFALENIIKLSPQCVPQNFLPFLITHEFTHICVDDDVRKYQLSHKTKERLVSRICSKLLNFDDFNSIRDEQTDKLITKDNLLNDYYSVLINLQKQSSAN